MKISFPLFTALSILTSGGFVLAAAPTAPSGLTGVANGAYGVDLAWTDNSNNESGFEIQYRVGTTATFTSLGTTAANEVSIDLTGTAPRTTYQFQIRAVSTTLPREYSAFAGPVTVVTPIGVSSAVFRAGLLGTAFSFNVTSSSPTLATNYAITALPDGLSMNPTTGAITGTPTTAGKVTGQVTITHSEGGPATAPLTIRVFKPQPALAAPVVAAALGAQTLTLGTAPAVVSAGAVFSDPDVSSAARLATDLGNIDYAFYNGSAPQTVANFLGYLNRGDFANTMFHRSVPGFIVQGGAFRADATASAVTTQPAVVNEPDITNVRGTVAMAKLGGNPDSATNQFFINLAANGSNLDNQNEGFTVFARVTGAGMTVANAIAALPRKSYASVNGALTDVPVRGATPPTVYDPTALVRVSAATVLAPLALTVTSVDAAICGAAVTGTDVTLSPALPGATTVTLTATDLDGQTVNSSFPVTVNDTLATWTARQNFATPADGDAGADPDGDGRVNLAEFALASAPLTAAAADPVLRLENSHLELTFTLREWMTGTTVTLQSATALTGPWTDEWKNTDGFTHPWIASGAAAGGVLTITARDPATLPDPAVAKKFLRLKIQ